jgi:hypothetical protein
MPWSRHFRAQAEALEHLPAPLGVHRAPERDGHPSGDLRPGPQPAIRRGPVERAGQRGPPRGREEPRVSRVTMAPVTQPHGAVLVRALGDGAHPVGRIAGDGGHVCGGQPLGEQPDQLPVAARDRLLSGAIASLQFVKREMWLNGKSFWHIPIIHSDLVSGGLLPCPSALVLLITAVSINRTALGIVMVVAFSLGLAGVLTAVGLLFEKGSWLVRRQLRLGAWGRLLPVASALVILVIGLWLTVDAVSRLQV